MAYFLIGIDEAGLAPNLGPLVITATLWELPSPLECREIWRSFAEALTDAPHRNDHRLHVADSKQVHQSQKGVHALERGVMSIFHLLNRVPETLEQLWHLLSDQGREEFQSEPWNTELALPLPHSVEHSELQIHAKRLGDCSSQSGIRLRAIRSEIVSPARFNRLIDQYQNKSLALSKLSFQLLRTLWDPHADDHVRIIGDKHGGRNRYDDFIREIAGDEFVIRVEESTACSIYRVRNAELRFQVGGEEHLPVAFASMISKYVREVSLIQFNRYFCSRIPELKPTKGYPGDAARFRDEVQHLQRELGIPDHQFWRSR